MRSQNVPYLPAVDHLRAFASVLIVLYHALHKISQHLAGEGAAPWIAAGAWPPGLLVEGHTAVSLFMVLSGFIFTYAALGRRIRYAAFLRNRLLRIYPLFVVLIGIGIATRPQAFGFAPLVQTLAGLANYPGALDLGAVSGMFWTIAIEVQFYLVFPLLLAVVNRDGARPLLWLCLAAIVARALAVALGAGIQQATYWTMLGRIDQFVIGMLAAWIFASPRFSSRAWARTTPVSLIGIVLLLQLYNAAGGFPSQAPWKVLWPTVEAAMWAAFMLSYLSAAKSLPARASTVLIRVGEISYSTYLLHFMLIHLLISRGWLIGFPGDVHTQSLLNGVLVALPATLLLAAVTYRAIERPFLALRGRYLADPAPD